MGIENNIAVIAVLDGHGRDVGKIAANAARASLLEYFTTHHLQLKLNPYECLVRAHEVAHFGIKEAFKQELGNQGFEVSEVDGYLMKRKGATQSWACVHGGSSCSICAIVDDLLYIANVGDSSGTLCSLHPVLSRIDVQQLGDSALAAGGRPRVIPAADAPCMERSTTMVLTAEHSPGTTDNTVCLLVIIYLCTLVLVLFSFLSSYPITFPLSFPLSDLSISRLWYCFSPTLSPIYDMGTR